MPYQAYCSCFKRKQIRTKPYKRCICNIKGTLALMTGDLKFIKRHLPYQLQPNYNKIRLNLFTERNSDGTANLVLQGKYLFERFNKRLQDTDIRAICLYIRETPKLITQLKLCYNEITDVGFKKLLKMLLVKSRSSIKYLDIMNNNITDKSIMSLAKYADKIKLKCLRINGNDLGPKGGEYLVEFLCRNKSLEFCDLGQTGQTLTSIARLVTALRLEHGGNTNLKVLDLSRINPQFNRYPLESRWVAYHLEYLFERNSSIIEIHLQKNELTGHDMEYLDRGLRRNNSLLYLDLSYNRIGEVGAEILAKWLETRPSLTVLNIAGNGIKDNGARALHFALPKSKIRALDLSQNKIGQTGLLCILNTIKKPYFLLYLNIWGNGIIGPIACAVIHRMLESGILNQNSIDLEIYKVDGVFYAAYRASPSRYKHFYYCEKDYGYSQPILHITKNKLKNVNKNIRLNF